MRLITSILIITILGCTSKQKERLSFWESKKNSFAHKRLNRFNVTDDLDKEYKSLEKVVFSINRWIDTVYLYSWQGSDSAKNEFTVVAKEFEHGPSIYLIICDKNDKIITSKRIAGSEYPAERDNKYGCCFFAKDSFYFGNCDSVFTRESVYAIRKDGGLTYEVTID